MPTSDPLSPHPESDLSEPQAPSPINSSSPSIESDRESQDEDMKDADSSVSASDEDAEGSEDDEYDIGPSTNVRQPTSPAGSSSSSDQGSRKRKLSEDDLEDAIAQHPELYGVRRSVSAKLIFYNVLLLTFTHRFVPASFHGEL
jgi:chromodomain-helicase-DNA-binding protein 1